MVRRTQQQRRAEVRARAAAVEALERENGSYNRPPRSDTRAKSWDTPVDDFNTIRIVTTIWRHDGALVDFVLILQTAGWGGSWRNVALVDCCDGHCHLHPDDSRHRELRQHLMRLDTVDDVSAAYRLATVTMSDSARRLRDNSESESS
ncbi:hypothetical protein N1031_04220 [Herbiconiux moechotypicola]|uniref:Uncharacterized protein n=1 Tax=Herbiconiux moechotypicola TaxID=637393 RepID=A0ABN3DAF8_9MICO|nr:hypothetical protein [Herbiconiux moechotypicola]MCS5728956.1 hypothetical protein [Herbiconiux moechotypicola]